MKQPVRTKKTTRPGKPSGTNGRKTIQITVNDPQHMISPLWEKIKSFYSSKHVTAAEVAAKCFYDGLMIRLEEMISEKQKLEAEQNDKNQMRLF